MKRNEIIEKIINYFEENDSFFNDCVEELDSYNGWLGDDRYYPMEEIDEFYHDEPLEAMRRAFYGYDEDDWYTDGSGNKVYGAFNPNRDYYCYNGYGNLVSSDWKDYSNYLDDGTISEMLKHKDDLYYIKEDDELAALFDELENCEE